jgi:L-cysteine:1D-myo-inositol 2-amino-2-deoxy-alpha-D-glucopyranoside ligase
VAHLTHAEMVAASRDNGGDPDRPGKKDPLDPLVWRARRPGEPAWDSPVGPGRPGWHIECAAIAQEYLDAQIHVQGGGSDLAFPHHECSAAHAEVASGQAPFAQAYVHTGMVGYDGHKMSKSRGNLVFVSALRAAGVPGSVLRLALLATRYRQDWEWTPSRLAAARERWGRWRMAVAAPAGPGAGALLEVVRARLADDLDTPAALLAVDAWVAAVLDGDAAGASGTTDASGTTGTTSAADPGDPTAPALVRDLVDALLGVELPVGE